MNYIEQNIIKDLINAVFTLSKKIVDLKEKLSINSQNSSKPPSSDFKKSKKKKSLKKKSDKKQGAQKGHKGSYRGFADTKAVHSTIDCKPVDSCICGGNININLDKYTRHQVYDTGNETNNILLTEYQIYRGYCTLCKSEFKGSLPAHLDRTIIGPGLKSLMGVLVSKYNLSKRKVVEYLIDFHKLKISVGTVSNNETKICQALGEVYEGISKAAKNATNLNADETRHYEKGETNWAWLAANESLTLLKLDKSRGKKAAKKLLGENYKGILTTDRYCVYNIVDISQRQLCWAHLSRDFLRISIRQGIPGKIGDSLIFHKNKLFYYWNKYKNNSISFSSLNKSTVNIKTSLKNSLTNAINCSHTKTANTCKNILKHFDGLWTFTEHEGIEPTNNLAEQKIRGFVIYRKLSFGTQSERGSRFIERIMTITMTCKQNSRNAIYYIKQSIINFNSGRPPPRILNAST